MTIDISDTHVLRGQQAIQALNAYVKGLQTQKDTDLTEEQKTALIKTARALSQILLNTAET